jgi:hypothetical protein
MAVTLAQSASLSLNYLQRGVIETFVELSPILDRLPLHSMEGNAYAYNEEATLPGVAFRAVNGSYTEGTGTVNNKTEILTILGGDAYVDRFIEQTRSNFNDQRAVQTRMLVKSAAMTFQNGFFNGDSSVDANSFDGLKKRLAGGQVLTAGTNGINVVGNGTTDCDIFFDQLDNLINAVRLSGGGDPDAMYANSTIMTKIRGAMRRKLLYENSEGVDQFGKTQVVYNGIPILDAGVTTAGALILPQTETVGTSNVTSSIYAVKWAQGEGDIGVMGLTNGGVSVRDLGELQTKPSYATRIEFYAGMAIFNGKSAARLTGILAG